jgi:hypothetical protein
MSDEAAAFDSEAEIMRCLLTPIADGSFRGQSIKAVVNFNRLEVSNVPRQILCGRKFSGIEAAFPVFVMPAGGADVESRRDFALSQSRVKDVRPQAKPLGSPPEASLGTVHRT